MRGCKRRPWRCQGGVKSVSSAAHSGVKSVSSLCQLRPWHPITYTKSASSGGVAIPLVLHWFGRAVRPAEPTMASGRVWNRRGRTASAWILLAARRPKHRVRLGKYLGVRDSSWAAPGRQMWVRTNAADTRTLDNAERARTCINTKRHATAAHAGTRNTTKRARAQHSRSGPASTTGPRASTHNTVGTNTWQPRRRTQHNVGTSPCNTQGRAHTTVGTYTCQPRRRT